MKKIEKYNAHKEWLEHPVTRELLSTVLPREEARVRTVLGWGRAKDWESYNSTVAQAQMFAELVEDIKDQKWFWEEEDTEA